MRAHRILLAALGYLAVSLFASCHQPCEYEYFLTYGSYEITQGPGNPDAVGAEVVFDEEELVVEYDVGGDHITVVYSD